MKIKTKCFLMLFLVLQSSASFLYANSFLIEASSKAQIAEFKDTIDKKMISCLGGCKVQSGSSYSAVAIPNFGTYLISSKAYGFAVLFKRSKNAYRLSPQTNALALLKGFTSDSVCQLLSNPDGGMAKIKEYARDDFNYFIETISERRTPRESKIFVMVQPSDLDPRKKDYFYCSEHSY
ncbi:hypothetical protein [Parendozoicomonas haliclonae]|uniref:Uncharacterized protein n=1 Tax=Parendozoicomonas haliclonae TaxID=1960125 RepID=A0A1X7AMN5_9GAMM|nr:hypothetical protein [Parendozoicomonas haliclonae]SMA49225.1 hypothetical protein EHSB41UT_03125 [Parendozoicomonas haliclonae]